MTRRPTIIDVAKTAGVSKSTVSLVLRNSPNVRETTRKQVRAAMRELGYVYNRAAALMRGGDAGLIGLVINDLRNPFFTEFATSLQMALARRGYATVIGNTDEDTNMQAHIISSMIEHGVSALILCPAKDTNAQSFDAIARAEVPAVQMLRKADERLDLFPFTAPDYVAGSVMATRHLIEMGARQIAFVGGLEGFTATRERKTGYLKVLAEIGMTPLVLTGRSSRAFGRETAHHLREMHPSIDAVLCFNDLVALGMLSGCHQLGRSVGSDFRLVGFDDIEDVAQTYPPLSSVRCDIAGIGMQAATAVTNWLEHGNRPPPVTRTPVTLVARMSSTGKED